MTSRARISCWDLDWQKTGSSCPCLMPFSPFHASPQSRRSKNVVRARTTSLASSVNFRQNPCQPHRITSVAKCVAAFTTTSTFLLEFKEKMLQNRTSPLAFSTTLKGNLGQQREWLWELFFCSLANQPVAPGGAWGGAVHWPCAHTSGDWRKACLSFHLALQRHLMHDHCAAAAWPVARLPRSSVCPALCILFPACSGAALAFHCPCASTRPFSSGDLLPHLRGPDLLCEGHKEVQVAGVPRKCRLLVSRCCHALRRSSPGAGTVLSGTCSGLVCRPNQLHQHCCPPNPHAEATRGASRQTGLGMGPVELLWLLLGC